MTTTTLDVRTTASRTPDLARRATRPRRAPAQPRSAAAQPRSAAARPRPTAGLRLTRRGRLVVVVMTLAAAFAGFTMRGAPAASTGDVHHMRTATVVVSPGETVWDIAGRVAPDADPRVVVDQIEQLNALPDAGSIRVGQPLIVPRG